MLLCLLPRLKLPCFSTPQSLGILLGTTRITLARSCSPELSIDSICCSNCRHSSSSRQLEIEGFKIFWGINPTVHSMRSRIKQEDFVVPSTSSNTTNPTISSSLKCQMCTAGHIGHSETAQWEHCQNTAALLLAGSSLGLVAGSSSHANVVCQEPSVRTRTLEGGLHGEQHEAARAAPLGQGEQHAGKAR